LSRCKGCGEEFKWIKTTGGKNMPVDPTLVMYWADRRGKDKICTPNGEMISCNLDGDPLAASGVGYIPHWATCPQANQFKRKRR